MFPILHQGRCVRFLVLRSKQLVSVARFAAIDRLDVFRDSLVWLFLGMKMRRCLWTCKWSVIRECCRNEKMDQDALVLHRKDVANADSSSGSWLPPNPGFGSDK